MPPMSEPDGNKQTGSLPQGKDEPFPSGFIRLKNTLSASDLVVRCGDASFDVHKAVIYPQSTFFAAQDHAYTLITSSSSTSASRSVVVLQDDIPTTVERLLSYLYTGEYGDDAAAHHSPFFACRTKVASLGQWRHDTMLLHANMYAAGDRYGVLPLKAAAEAKFKAITKQSWPFQEFHIIVARVYASTPKEDRGLRDVIFQLCVDHLEEVSAGPCWKQMMADHAAVALGVELVPKVVEMKDKEIRDLKERLRGGSADRPNKKQKTELERS
ncbi:MAG: hypothetical protein Q9184_002301 [Pyrenodesmia sp. 2 TL-2023]